MGKVRRHTDQRGSVEATFPTQSGSEIHGLTVWFGKPLSLCLSSCNKGLGKARPFKILFGSRVPEYQGGSLDILNLLRRTFSAPTRISSRRHFTSRLKCHVAAALW